MTARSILFRAALLAVVMLAAEEAYARMCGDSVDGRDVPCFCGDTVGSSVVLTDDPVTTRQCPGDALVVRVSLTREELQIDLNGKTLRGSGRGAGIWVMAGGRNGAKIVSNGAPATIQGFRDGIIGRVKNTISRIDNVTLLNNSRDGIRVFADRVQIHDSEARGSGRHGFSVRGRFWLLEDVRAVNNRRDGFNVTGTAGMLGIRRGGALAEGNGRNGFTLMGSTHRVVECIAVGGGDGVVASGAGHEINGCVAAGNRGDGIKGTASFSRVVGNLAERNGGDGLVFRGYRVEDLGGNLAYENGLRESRQVKQCEIDRTPCR